MPTQAQAPVASNRRASVRKAGQPPDCSAADTALTRNVAPVPKVLNGFAIIGAALKPGRLPAGLDLDAAEARHVHLDPLEVSRGAGQRVAAVLDDERQTVVVGPLDLHG